MCYIHDYHYTPFFFSSSWFTTTLQKVTKFFDLFSCPDWLLVVSFLISHSLHSFYSPFPPLPFSLFFTPKLVFSTLCYLCFVIFQLPIYLHCGVSMLVLHIVCILLLLMLYNFLTICALVVFCVHIFCLFNCFHFLCSVIPWLSTLWWFFVLCSCLFCKTLTQGKSFTFFYCVL
jgi:hypothetical protein